MAKGQPTKCRWCHQPFSGKRKFCSSACRYSAQKATTPDPTLEEIREMCCRIREEGGQAWEQTRACYTPAPVQLRVVAVRDHCFSAFDE